MLINIYLWSVYFSVFVLYYNNKFTLKISDILSAEIAIVAMYKFF